MIGNILALLRGNIKCLIYKLLLKHIIYHPYIRLRNNVKFVVKNNSKIILKRGVLIGSNCTCSATDGGILKIGSMVGLNNNCMIVCHNSIQIGENTIMGPGVLIYDHDHVFSSVKGVCRNSYISSPIVIGKNCWIGANSIILRGSIIGDNCLIGAGSIIKGNYPEGSIVIQKKEETIGRRD